MPIRVAPISALGYYIGNMSKRVLRDNMSDHNFATVLSAHQNGIFNMIIDYSYWMS